MASTSRHPIFHSDLPIQPQILLVDDDPDTLQALQGLLRLRLPHARINTCYNAGSALQSLQTADYDAIVSDVRMPGMNGLAFIKEVKRLHPCLSVLIVTAHATQAITAEAYSAGAYDLLYKPIDRDAFMLSVMLAIQRTRLSRQAISGREHGSDEDFEGSSH
jgi:two-component system, sensor histidine kinase and response regulator